MAHSQNGLLFLRQISHRHARHAEIGRCVDRTVSEPLAIRKVKTHGIPLVNLQLLGCMDVHPKLGLVLICFDMF